MSDDLPPADVVSAALKEEAQPGPIAPITALMIPLADQVRNTLASIPLMSLARATPEERTALVRLYDEIARVQRDATTWLDAITLGWRRAAVELGNARQIPLADGIVEIEPQREEWKVDVDGLERELREYAKNGGVISSEEIDSMVTTVVTKKADGTKLNYFARNRGEEVAAIIERHRERRPGDPMSAKVRVKRRAES